jgi:hypothetical protein
MEPIRITLIASLCGLFCCCSTGNPAKFDNSDWAIDTYFPGQNEIDLPAKGQVARFGNYVARL